MTRGTRTGRALAALSLLLALAACAGRPPTVAEARSPFRWHAVLVGADGSLPVFDNATAKLAAGLAAGGVQDIRRFSASRRRPEGADPALLPAVTEAIAALRPAPGEGCLVFVTSHGAPGRGLVFAASRAFLSPALLDAALNRGCGEAPTAVIASGCFSGNFAAAPMARSNRVVLTAARADRPSFGCGAGFFYTVFDACLAEALDAAAPAGWAAVAGGTRGCVEREEARLSVPASEPQFFTGDRVRTLPVPWKPVPSS
ncbi:C13 family peptidase [Roseomonas sp. BN140053]|uniref:C13 family peptidase n=1 Tax=Roseomonas sp. BN140053 TaxID=3391898 RepID=UPI0039EB8E64